MIFEEAVNMRGFPWKSLPDAECARLDKATDVCRAMVVAMTARANSGHPAGAISSVKMLLTVYGGANLTPENCDSLDRDFVVISHGHASAGAYAALAYYGFVDPFDALNEFRKTGSSFQGHVDRMIPGIDWGTGCLGQGLSAGAGFALAQRARGCDGHVYVLMGDGEQPKGQVAEARRLIITKNLKNITVMIDANDIQITGRCSEVFPVNIRELWEADGWKVLECDGDSFTEMYAALKEARESDQPTAILCRTIIGKGVSFMEDTAEYHGKAATGDLYLQAMKELGQPDLIALAASHAKPEFAAGRPVAPVKPVLDLGTPKIYTASDKTDNRSAFGGALGEIGELNYKRSDRTPILVFDCDLAGSVKTNGFQKKCPDNFIQGGIQESNTASAAGAATVGGVVSVWADFGVFGLAEAYNQQRMNDANQTNEKLVLTHVGLDVGEDGKTHQCIDYVGLSSNFFHWKLIVPADPNQTDRATRWALGTPGNICLAMGRSKVPTICADDKPLFACEFKYGEAIKVREGKDAAILALGVMVGRAIEAAKILSASGIEAAVYAVSCPLEVDEKALRESFATGCVVTVEDHNINTGMGSIWLSRAAELGLSACAARIGVHRYGDSGPSAEVYDAMGLSPEKIAAKISAMKNCK